MGAYDDIKANFYIQYIIIGILGLFFVVALIIGAVALARASGITETDSINDFVEYDNLTVDANVNSYSIGFFGTEKSSSVSHGIYQLLIDATYGYNYASEFQNHVPGEFLNITYNKIGSQVMYNMEDWSGECDNSSIYLTTISALPVEFIQRNSHGHPQDSPLYPVIAECDGIIKNAYYFISMDGVFYFRLFDSEEKWNGNCTLKGDTRSYLVIF